MDQNAYQKQLEELKAAELEFDERTKKIQSQLKKILKKEATHI